MKQTLKVLAAILAVSLTVATACSKSEDGADSPVVDFSNTANTLFMGGKATIPIVLSAPAEKPATIDLKFEGTAVKGSDYNVSSESVTITEGSLVGSIVITDLNMSEGKDIRVSIDKTSGARKGSRTTTTVTCPGELLKYSFDERTEGNIIERYYVRIKLTGSKTGESWRAKEDMEIPAILTGEGASLLYFCDDEGAADSRGFVVKAGSNIGEICLGLKTASAITSVKKATLAPDVVSYNGVTGGDSPDFTLLVQGHYDLTGTWRFEKFNNEDAIKAAFEAAGDDASLLPLNNANFYLKITTETRDNIEYTVIEPAPSGDFASFFTKADITGCTPKGTREGFRLAGSSTVIEDGISYLFLKLSNCNRSFDKNAMIYGEGCISIRILDGGKLEITLRDYNKPPFGSNSWTEGSFNPDLFGFSCTFTNNK